MLFSVQSQPQEAVRGGTTYYSSENQPRSKSTGVTYYPPEAQKKNRVTVRRPKVAIPIVHPEVNSIFLYTAQPKLAGDTCFPCVGWNCLFPALVLKYNWNYCINILKNISFDLTKINMLPNMFEKSVFWRHE